jgi:hypothetical protein
LPGSEHRYLFGTRLDLFETMPVDGNGIGSRIGAQVSGWCKRKFGLGRSRFHQDRLISRTVSLAAIQPNQMNYVGR